MTNKLSQVKIPKINIKIPKVFSKTRYTFNIHQKIFSIYIIGLIIFFMIFPLGGIGNLEDSNVNYFKLFNIHMIKTTIIICLTLFFLFIYNIHQKLRHLLYTIFGWINNPYWTNIGGLSIILIALFSIGDTLILVKQMDNPKIVITKGYLIIGIYVIIGLVSNIMIARIEHKRSRKTTEINIKEHDDETQLESRFEQAQKEVDGLFGETNTLENNRN